MKRILIIDDNLATKTYYRQILEANGFDVDEAINGVDGLEKALCKSHDLYIVDVNIPKLDGYGFMRQLRTEDIHQAPAFMLLTEARTCDHGLTFQVGANGCLIKPVKSEYLLFKVRLLLAQAKL
jgi:two-component system chemotaxis response regulator CheY